MTTRRANDLSPADVVTILNAIFGFLAIALFVHELAQHPRELTGGIRAGELKLAGGLIGLGALCDVADGFVARATWSSAFGTVLDIMADAITFGAAPALVVVVAGFAFPSPVDALALVAATTYIVAVVVRLARHAIAPHAPSDGFVGITSPLGALGLIAVLAVGLGPAFTVAGVFFVSGLMLVPVRYPHQSHPALMSIILTFVCLSIGALAGALSFRFVMGAGLLTIVVVPLAGGVLHSARWRVARPRRAGIRLVDHDE